MAQPRKRKHPHHTNTPKVPKGIMYSKIIPVAVIIFILFGTGIAYFAAGNNITWLITGAILGAATGAFFGYRIAKGLSRK